MLTVMADVTAMVPTPVSALALACLLAAVQIEVRAVGEPYLIATQGESYLRCAAARAGFCPCSTCFPPARGGRARPARNRGSLMRDWLIGLGITAAVIVASWLPLILLARRLSPGILRDLTAFIPDSVTTVRRLRKDPRVPRKAKIAVVFAGLWVASPIDLIPEFLPVVGPLEDIVVVALCLRYTGRQVPRAVILPPGQAILVFSNASAGPATQDRHEEAPEP